MREKFYTQHHISHFHHFFHSTKKGDSKQQAERRIRSIQLVGNGTINLLQISHTRLLKHSESGLEIRLPSPFACSTGRALQNTISSETR